MKRIILFSIWAFLAITSASADTIYDVAMGVPVTRSEMLNQLAVIDTVIVGEKHYSPKVQTETAQVLAEWSDSRRQAVTLAWEFLSWSDRNRVQPLYKMFIDGLITSEGLLKAIFGTESGEEAVYSPMFDSIKKNGGYLLETNLTRAEKAPVTQGGIKALDPSLLPPNFAVGSANYLERFTEAMGEHVPPEKISNYFEAQCLVDDVAAYHIDVDAPTNDVFLVIGNFHMLYGDGVVSRIRTRSPTRLPMTIMIDEAVDYPEAEREAMFKHLRYGNIANYVILKD